MIRKALVSPAIIIALYKLGFDEESDDVYPLTKLGGEKELLWRPNVDHVIDWLRRKHNIVIYNAIEPFVDPTAKKPRILYRYSVKKCNLRDGWNGRKYIGESKLVENIYSAKRQAIMIALRYIKSQKNDKRCSTLNE